MATLPPKRHAILVVDPDAVAPGTTSGQLFQAVPRRHPQIVQPHGDIQHLQLPLHDPPEIARDSPRVTGVPLPEQVGRGLVGERLDHAGATVVT